MTIDSKIITLKGNLLDVIKKVDPLTIKHSSEIQKERLTDISLREIGFWTGDFPLYRLENNKIILYVADVENNLIFKNIDEAVRQLREKDNYFPNDSDISAVINARSTLKINLADLNLIDYDEKHSFFEIDTANKNQDKIFNYDTLNLIQRSLAKKVYGPIIDDFAETMDMLYYSNIITTRIHVLNPEYIRKTLHDNNKNSLARVTFLGDLDENYSYFDADNNDITNTNTYLRRKI